MQRYFLTTAKATNKVVPLPKDIAHHLMTVLRAKVGTQIEVVLSDHHVYQASVINVADPTIKIEEDLHQNSELPFHVTVACGIPKTTSKLEIITQKATELGAFQIVFFDAKRSVSRWNQKKRVKKISHLQKIANSASEQSHRNVQPKVLYGGSLSQLLANFTADQKVVAWEESAKQGEKSRLVQVMSKLQSGQSLLAIFGPEGGLTSDEVETMGQTGVTAVGLGPRILRTETAPLYFLAAVSALSELGS